MSNREVCWLTQSGTWLVALRHLSDRVELDGSLDTRLAAVERVHKRVGRDNLGDKFVQEPRWKCPERLDCRPEVPRSGIDTADERFGMCDEFLVDVSAVDFELPGLRDAQKRRDADRSVRTSASPAPAPAAEYPVVAADPPPPRYR